MDHVRTPLPPRFAWFVGILALIAFANAVDAGFVYDDTAFVTANQSVIGEAGIFTEPTPPQRADLGLYRPVTVWTYWLQFTLHGLVPSWFHALNVLLHVLVSVLVLRVAHRFGAAPVAALTAGVLFAVHPIHVEAVAWIVGRAELLTAAFALAGVLLFGTPAQPGPMRGASLAAVAYALACLAKETALPLPAALFVLDVVRRDGAPWRRVFFRQIPLTFVCIGVCVTRVAVLGHFVPDPTLPDLAHVQQTARGALILGVCGRWLKSLVWPVDSSIYYNPERFVDAAAQLLGLVAIAIGTFLGVVAWRRRSRPLACGLALSAVAALPFLQLVPIGAVFGDRFVYLGSAGFLIAVAALLPLDSPSSGARRVTRTFVVIAVAGGLIATWLRNPAFRDEVALWQDAQTASPRDAHPHYVLGRLYFDRGQIEYQSSDLKGALFHLSESLRIDAKHPWAGPAHITLGECAAGKRGDPLQKHVDALTAAEHYRAAIPLLGEDPTDALLDLAALHGSDAVDAAEARVALEAVLRIARDERSITLARSILAELDASAPPSGER
ncbi:MAG: hypothetical protein IT459_12610 [Planctomycetes bacterium]|nr:hypothetical protein [Planctomycetota bacterium]